MPRHRKLMLAATAATTGAAIVASALIVMPAHGTPASGFGAVQQWRGLFGPLKVKGEKTGDWDVKIDSKGETDLHVVRNSIAVGGHSGWHRHPGPSLITVTVGEITAYESSDPLCSPKVYGAGEGFVDHGDHPHLLRNESSGPAETVAVQFLPRGAARRIDANAPNNCTF